MIDRILNSYKVLNKSSMPLIMGILNVTPDSFSDGGLYNDVDRATRRALFMESEGADIIDIGGESTRPGADPVDLDTELNRVIPVIKSIRERSNIPISIDTYKSKVAEEALRKGANIINDISGLTFDKNMVKVAKNFDVPVIIMHIKGSPKNMQKNPYYSDVVNEIMQFFKKQIDFAIDSGISEKNIIIDPGIGFGKTLEHNLIILARLEKFKELGFPILIGVSRKSFIGNICGIANPEERLYGTLGAVSVSTLLGVDIIRVHDVKPAIDAIKVSSAIRGAVKVSPHI